MNKHWPFILILIVSGCFIFYQLGVTHLLEWDEAIYASVAKNIFQNGDWLTLFYNYSRWYQKPPLYFWLTVPMLKVFGLNSLSVRFWSAVFGLGGIVTTYFLAKKLFPQSKFVPFLSALFLLTNFQYLYYSRLGMLDVSVTFFILLSFLFFFKAKEKPVYFLFSSLATGLAVMTKGMVGLFSPLILGIFFALHVLIFRQIPQEFKLPWRHYLGGLVVFLIIVLPWHIYGLLTYKYDFFREYFLYHIGSRTLQGIEGHTQPRFWYWEVIRFGLKPSFFLLFPAIFYYSYQFFTLKRKIQMPLASILFLIVWFGAVFIFFTAAESKLIWYIIPLYPCLAIFLGEFIGKIWGYLRNWFSALKRLDNFLFLCCIFFAVVYLLLLREKIYPQDFTGPFVHLIEEKNKIDRGPLIIGAGDKITTSVALFYSNGRVFPAVPSEVMGQLEQRLASLAIVRREVYEKMQQNEWLKSKGVKLTVLAEEEGGIILIQAVKSSRGSK